jgi:hypothetical protein
MTAWSAMLAVEGVHLDRRVCLVVSDHPALVPNSLGTRIRAAGGRRCREHDHERTRQSDERRP